MREWCAIIPFHRPALSGHVVAYLLRQIARPAAVCVVGNGQGIDGLRTEHRTALEAAGIRYIPAKCPIAHPGHARNRGKQVALAAGFDWMICLDSDDHYGPGLLAETELHALPERLTGKRCWRCIDNRGGFMVEYPNGPGLTDWVGGYCQAYHRDLAKVVTYPDTAEGEDVLFCQLAARIGCEVFDTGPEEFVYERRGEGHAWKKDARSYLGLFHTLSTFDPAEIPWITTPAEPDQTKEPDHVA